MNKLLIILFSLFLIVGCSEGVQKFDCGGFGVTVSNNKLTYGPTEYFFCNKIGNWRNYSPEKKMCDSFNKEDPSVTFDEITYNLTVSNPPQKYFEIISCKKIN